MRKIEPGMLVRIVYREPFYHGAQFAGHVGEVTGTIQHPSQGECYYVSGAEKNPATGNSLAFSSNHIRPIDPPKTTTWENVAEDTGWNPTKQPVRKQETLESRR